MNAAPASPPAVIPRESWDLGPWNRWTFQRVREMVPTTPVWRGTEPATPWPVKYQDLGSLLFDSDGRRQSIETFIAGSETDGFLVLHRGAIVTEIYCNGMTPRSTHLSQSVSKSVVGILAGILAGRGLLKVAALVTDYLPELDSTAYRGATVQQLLDMTTGVAWDENYTAPDSHMARMDAASGWKERKDPSWPRCMWEVVASLRERECDHGAAFRYRSIETDVLAFVLQRVSGLPLAELVSRELWVPLGAQEDAYFTVDPAGFVCANGGFNATLRDYGRFAQLLVDGGMIGGRQLVPRAWIEETRRADHAGFGDVYRASLPAGAYHNQFWIEDSERRAFMARGVFGQLIYIDPQAQFAAVKLSSWPDFLDLARSRTALAAVHAIRDALRDAL